MVHASIINFIIISQIGNCHVFRKLIKMKLFLRDTLLLIQGHIVDKDKI